MCLHRFLAYPLLGQQAVLPNLDPCIVESIMQGGGKGGWVTHRRCQRR